MHHLQVEAERVTPAELLSLLVEFAAARQRLLARHEAVARAVPEYDFNNTCQYIIAREETHLTWLDRSIRRLGGELPVGSAATHDPGPPSDGSAVILDAEASRARAFVEGWRDRVAGVTDARERRMLEVVLGETLEHARMFAQAAAGRGDVLGRRPDGARPAGRVLPQRWVE
ncbi:MAG: hypothetical protein ACE148_01510 [Vicinamibacterales bacterium]